MRPLPYSAYKPSGVEWLGDLPEHWDICRLKRVCRFEYGDSLDSESRILGGTAVYGSNGVVGHHNEANTEAPCIVIGRKGSFGKVNFSYDSIFAIDTTFFVDARYSNANMRWLYYLLGWLRLDAVTKDSAIPGLDREDAYRRFAPLPRKAEQSDIARFLDHATDQVEHYIRAKEKLIALLKEQKQVIIHDAVTGQIDVRTGKPYPTYKHSGVEWLGELPTHWDVTALRFRYSQCLGKMLDTKRITGKHLIPYLRNVDVQWDRINTQELPTMDIPPEEFERFTVKPGDLLVCEGGEVGRCALWSGDLPLCGFQKALHRLRPISIDRDVPRFLCYALKVATHRNAFDDGHESTISHLTGEKFRAHRFPFPPHPEQEAIHNFLDSKLSVVDGKIDRENAQIALVNEYRTRLIADVVTGKLDVRKAAANLPELETIADSGGENEASPTTPGVGS